MPEGDVIRPVNSSAPEMLSAEETLRAIFTQAFAQIPLHLPAGATPASLRAALALDAVRIAELFAQVRAQARGARQAARRRRNGLRIGLAFLGLAVCAAGLAVGGSRLIRHPAVALPAIPTAQLYSAAMTDKTAFALLQQRAKSGDAVAGFDLATLADSNLLHNETSLPKNDALAFRWYLAAAKAGLPEAEDNLAFAYQTGHGVARDDVKAVAWFQSAADAGLADAQNALARLYQQGRGVPRNDALAVHWYQRAAAQGLASAENDLGAAYEAGSGIPQDEAAAALWFGRAAAQGEPNAENSLGYLYFTGQGGVRDVAQAHKWFAAAAAQGLASGQLNLGLCYVWGAGVAQNNLTAAMWFLLARERGNQQAADALASLFPPLTPTQAAAARLAAQNWDRAAQSGAE